MSLTVTDILKFRESESDPWQRLLLQANINFNLIYPVGSIYMSTVNVNPATLFGGTWEQLEDRFLLGAGTTYTAGDTGGEAEHTLIENELPKISGAFGLHGQENGTIVYNIVGKATGVQVNRYQTIGNSYTTATSYQSPGFAFGGDQPHNNMPPYIVVYMWKRLTLSPSLTPLPMNVLGDVASEDIVPVSKGGTGADNAEDAIANLGFESGTGHCKMPDGTLMCWGSVSVGAGAWSAVVSLPASFANTQYAVVDTPRCNTTVAVNVLVGKTGVDNITFYMTRNDLSFEIDYLAIGRWK